MKRLSRMPGRSWASRTVSLMTVYDEEGRQFQSLKSACRFHSLVDDGKLYVTLRKKGYVAKGGHCFYSHPPGELPCQGDDVPAQQSDDTRAMNQLRELYRPEELEKILSGEGLARPAEYPKIVLHGSRHRMMVISDTHIGSRFSPYEWHDLAARTAREEGCDCVLHCGDLTEGMKIARMGTQMYELTDLGYEAQRDRAIELMSKYEMPVYIISGNHDGYFREYAGVDIVKAVAEKVDGMEYLGYDSADIEVEGAIVRLWHGGDGNSYALSYRLQKVIEALPGGRKPDILLAGHVHKFCYVFERNVHGISVPCMQMQTKWMQSKKIAAHTGFLILDFEVANGCVCNLSVRLFPFYA